MARLELDGSATNGLVRFRARQRQSMLYRANVLGPIGSICQLYVGTVAPTQFRDGTQRGQGDVAEYPNGLIWPGGMDLIFQWDIAGACSAHIEFEEG